VIELEAHAIKGVGREHAKWSPVATAWYRLRPEVVLLQRVAGADAKQLVEEFRNKDGTPGLFVLEGEELCVRDARDYENRLEEVGGVFGRGEGVDMRSGSRCQHSHQRHVPMFCCTAVGLGVEAIAEQHVRCVVTSW
jgi:hypothetical protein